MSDKKKSATPPAPPQTLVMPPPPNLNDQTMLNTEIAKSQAIVSLTKKDESLEMLSAISEHDVARLSLLSSIGGDKTLNLDDTWTDEKGVKHTSNFLLEFVGHELGLDNSVIRKTGGIRSEQLKTISKSPDVQEGESFIQKMGNRFRR